MGRWVGLGMFVVLASLPGCSDDGSSPADVGDTEAGSSSGGSSDAGASSDGSASGGSASGSSDSAESESSAGSDTADGATTGADTGEAGCTVGSTAPSQVVLVGDSYLDITTVPQELYARARAAGSLGTGEEYRDYSLGGTQLSTGEIGGQFQRALTDDPDIRFAVMTGGGNDVLIGAASGCLQDPPPAQACVDAIDDVLAAAQGLLNNMTINGVEKVVYFFYPHLPEGFPMGAKNETLDYAAPLARELCESQTGLECYFVDIRDAFEGHPEYISNDGIHPSDAGSAVIADLVWATMEANCIAP